MRQQQSQTQTHRSRAHASRLASVLCAALLVATAACGSDDNDNDNDDDGKGKVSAASYSAEIAWTEGGVPHVTAASWGDAGFGSGYAFASLNLCLLSDQVVKVNSERARYFGPGDKDANIESDFFELFLGVRAKAEQFWPKLHPDVQQLLQGYAAGVNHYLASKGDAGVPAQCRGAAWVKPIAALDIMTYMMDIAVLASARALPSLGPVQIYAKPPVQGSDAGGDDDKIDPATMPGWLRAYQDAFSWQRLDQTLRTAQAVIDRDLFALPGHEPIGSNGIALGKDKTADGRGMVLGNPHFPWAGELRFWQLHVRIPGIYDVGGAGLTGSPIPNIGFNGDLAWTHTVSKSMKFNAYRLKLVAGKPTTYLYEGAERAMTAHVHNVEVKQADGTMHVVERTYYRSHYGPVIAISALAEWTNDTAYTIRDANENNHALLEHFMRVGQSHSVAELDAVMSAIQANPWVNTLAADRDGQAFYAESNSVPNISAASYAAHKEAVAGGDVLAGILADYGIFVLDGSVARDEWAADQGSREPGLVPWAKTPHATATTYLANANESYWLSNVETPLPTAAAIFGDRDTPRTLRTRVVLHEAADVGDGSAAGADGKFTVDELAAIPFRARVLSAELGLVGALDLCKSVTSTVVSGDTVDLVPACAALASWDGNDSVQSKGGILWRETLSDFMTSLSEHLVWSDLFSVPFDSAKPLTTPNTLAWQPKSGKPSKFLVSLGKATWRLNKAKIPLDGALGDWQFLPRGAEKLPIPGGIGAQGSFNVTGYAGGRDSSLLATIERSKLVNGTTDLTEAGYVVNYGSSFMMAVGFDEAGPVGKQILTYSQSSEPDSPHFSDQTQKYGEGTWYTIRYHAADIDASPNLVRETVSN